MEGRGAGIYFSRWVRSLVAKREPMNEDRFNMHIASPSRCCFAPQIAVVTGRVARDARSRRLGNGGLEIAQPQVKMADRHPDQHQAKSVLGIGRKAEIDP